MARQPGNQDQEPLPAVIAAMTRKILNVSLIHVDAAGNQSPAQKGSAVDASGACRRSPLTMATRLAKDDPYEGCPPPDVIADRVREIQAGWTDGVRLSRSGYVQRPIEIRTYRDSQRIGERLAFESDGP